MRLVAADFSLLAAPERRRLSASPAMEVAIAALRAHGASSHRPAAAATVHSDYVVEESCCLITELIQMQEDDGGRLALMDRAARAGAVEAAAAAVEVAEMVWRKWHLQPDINQICRDMVLCLDVIVAIVCGRGSAPDAMWGIESWCAAAFRPQKTQFLFAVCGAPASSAV